MFGKYVFKVKYDMNTKKAIHSQKPQKNIGWMHL